MQHFSGLFVLRGSGTSLDVFIKDQFLFGNTCGTKMDTVPKSTYDFSLCGAYEKIYIPNKSTDIVCSSGDQTSFITAAVLGLNHEKLSGLNYPKLLNEKVFKDIPRYSVSLGYLSNSPNIILSSRKCSIYTWVVIYKGCYFYLWSSDKNYVKSLSIPPKTMFLATAIKITNSTLVIQPVYWQNKFARAYSYWKTVNSQSQQLMAYNYLISYITNHIEKGIHAD